MQQPTPQQSLTTMPVEGRLFALALCSLLIVLTTTVPYLTLINVLFFSGIFWAGFIALHQTILRYQVPLSLRNAFVLGSLAGFVGGLASELLGIILMLLFDYRPGIEILSLIVEWATQQAMQNPELQEQVNMLQEAEKLAKTPITLGVTDVLFNLAVTGMVYAPIAGLGGMFAVRWLKFQAARK